MTTGSLTGDPETLAEAEASLREGELDAAIEQFTAVLQVAPDVVAALRGRAVAHFQRKAWAEARADFARARELDPADLESWVGLGMSLAMAHEIYPAIEVFETLLAHHPDYARGHLQLGLLYYKLCVTAKGRKHLEQALTCRPTREQRQLIEQVLGEQAKLDRGRYYRPDFAALRASRASGSAG